MVAEFPFRRRSATAFRQDPRFLAGQSTPIGPYDLQIGAIALAAV